MDPVESRFQELAGVHRTRCLFVFLVLGNTEHGSLKIDISYSIHCNKNDSLKHLESYKKKLFLCWYNSCWKYIILFMDNWTLAIQLSAEELNKYFWNNSDTRSRKHSGLKDCKSKPRKKNGVLSLQSLTSAIYVSHGIKQGLKWFCQDG